jgi:outer membrane protein assembly factor BamB
MRIIALGLVAAGLLAGLCAGVESGSDWPQFRGPTRDGISTEAAWSHDWPLEGPKRLWTAQVGAGFSSMTLSGSKLYTMGNAGDQDSVWCLDALAGTVVWRHRYPCKLDPKYYTGGTSSTPTIADGLIYSLSKAGQLFCLDAATGAVRWSKEMVADFGIKPPTWGFASSGLIEGNLLLLNVGKAGLALDRTSGAVVWNSGDGPCGYASPVAYTVAGKRVLALFGGEAMHGVDLASGALRWTYAWKTEFGENSPDPIVSDGRLFITSGHGAGSALLDLGDGGQPTLLWSNKDLGNHIAASVLCHGHYYGFTGRVNHDDGGFGCVDAATGTTSWFIPNLRGSLIAAGDRLLILTLKSELVIAAVDPTSYRELARAQVLPGLSWTAPVIVQNRVYVRNAKGEVACYDLSKP